MTDLTEWKLPADVPLLPESEARKPLNRRTCQIITELFDLNVRKSMIRMLKSMLASGQFRPSEIVFIYNKSGGIFIGKKVTPGKSPACPDIIEAQLSGLRRTQPGKETSMKEFTIAQSQKDHFHNFGVVIMASGVAEAVDRYIAMEGMPFKPTLYIVYPDGTEGLYEHGCDNCEDLSKERDRHYYAA